MEKYSLKQIKQSIKKPWVPFEVARFNNQVLRVAVFEGEYHWHMHENEDEFFLVYKGSITINTEIGSITLNEGEGTVKERATVLMIEPINLKSQGD